MSSCAKILDELEKIYRFKKLDYLSNEISSHLIKCPSCEAESKNLSFYFERIEVISERMYCPDKLFEELKEALYKKIEKDFIRAAENSSKRTSKDESVPGIITNIKTASENSGRRGHKVKSEPSLVSEAQIEDDKPFPYRITNSNYSPKSGLKEKIITVVWIIGIIFLLLLSYFGFDFYQETAPWRVGLVEGGYKISGNPFTNDEIYEANILTTSADSRAIISVPGGGKITLLSDTELKIMNTWKNFKKVKLIKGKIILSQFSGKSDFNLIAGKIKINPLGSVTEVQRNILGKTIVECTNLNTEIELDEKFIVPKNYLVEVSEDDVFGFPFSRGTNSAIIESIKRINKGIFTDENFKTVAQSSTEKDIFSLVQLLKIAKGESKAIIFKKLREYSIPPGEVIRVSPESLSDEDINTWTDRLLIEKNN